MVPERPTEAHSSAELVERFLERVLAHFVEPQLIGEVRQGYKGVLGVPTQVHKLAFGHDHGLRKCHEWEVGGKQPRGGERGQVRIRVLEIELGFQERHEFVWTLLQQRMVRSSVGLGVGGAVQEGEEDGFEPRGAGLGCGHEEDVGVQCPEVALSREDTAQAVGAVPEALVEVQEAQQPPLLERKGRKELSAFIR